MQKTFAELVESAKGKDQEAISEIYNRTYPGVYKTAKAIIQDEDAVLDIVQDAYIKAFQNLHQLDDPDKFPAWVKRIAVNQAKDYLKKKKPILFSEMENEEGDAPEFRDDNMDVQPEAVVDRQDTTELISRILSTLGDEQRITIVMFYYQELSVEEIAKAQGCSVNTVKSRLNYGRKKVEKAVLKLEKQGVRLYSMAPLPFLLWLFKAAKTANISAASLAQVSAVGAATAGAAAGTTAAGEAAAGSTAAGNAAATATAKAVGGTAAKAVSTKIIAGALAITIAGGGAAAAVNHINLEKENAAAHEMYTAFLDDYRETLEMDHSTYFSEEHRCWDELKEAVMEKYPDDLVILGSSDEPATYIADGAELEVMPYTEDPSHPREASRLFKRELLYCWGDKFIDSDIPLPDTRYNIFMHSLAPLYLQYNEVQADYGFFDVTDDGIDELFLEVSSLVDQDVGILYIFQYEDERIHMQICYDTSAGHGINGDVLGFSQTDNGREYEILFRFNKRWTHPSTGGYSWGKLHSAIFRGQFPLESIHWQALYRPGQKFSNGSLSSVDPITAQTSMREEEKMKLLRSLEGTYRFYAGITYNMTEYDTAYRPCHELTVSIVGNDIVITDIGEPADVAQLRQLYIDCMIDHSKKAYSRPPSSEELDYLTIANLGTLTIPIEDISVVGNSASLQFNPTGFSGGEQSLPVFNCLSPAATTEMGVYDWEHLILEPMMFDTKIHLMTPNGQELEYNYESYLVLERQ